MLPIALRYRICFPLRLTSIDQIQVLLDTHSCTNICQRIGDNFSWPTYYNVWYRKCAFAWWRHQMETFSALQALCAGNSPVTGEFPAQRPVTRSFDVFFDLWLNKRLSKHSWGWWSETSSSSLWRHCNGRKPRGSCNNSLLNLSVHWYHMNAMATGLFVWLRLILSETHTYCGNRFQVMTSSYCHHEWTYIRIWTCDTCSCCCLQASRYV